jgi:uncharacterized protein DUF3300
MRKRDRISVVLTFCMLLSSVACKNQQSTATSGAQPQGPAQELKPLDQLLAPIALYPDGLLAQVLACATSPQQVTEMNNWLQQNKQLQGTDLQDAANQQGFDASFVALALFPDVIKMMATNLDWTTEVGTAFLSDQKAVMDSVQKLRGQAMAVGNLKTTPQQIVTTDFTTTPQQGGTTESKGGQQVIVIQPANPQVVYVPVYNTQTVYTSPPPAPTATSSSSSSNDSGKTAAAALIGFGLGIAIGSSMNNNYYAPYGYGAWGMGWHTNTVIVTGGAWRVPPYARYPYTRPVPVPYGGYRPPANVYAPRYSNVNVNVNNVNANRNVYSGGSTPRPQPYSAPATRPTRPATPPPAYPTGATAQRSASTLTAPATRPGTTSAASPSTQAARAATAPGSRPNTTQAQPAVSGSGARPGSQPANTPQRSAQPSTAGISNYGSRGYSQSASKVPSNSRTAESAQTSSSAFSGYQSGSAERAASQRGQSSISNSQSQAGQRGQSSISNSQSQAGTRPSRR